MIKAQFYVKASLQKMSVKPTTVDCHVMVTTPGLTALELLASEAGISKQKIKDAMNKGAVWLTRGKKTQRLRRVKFMPVPGDRLRICVDPQLLALVAPTPTLLADNQGYSVWYKPPMLMSQGSIWGDHCSLLRLVEQYFQQKRRVFLVHRLDREASGLMLVAHHAQMAGQLSAMFQDHRISKHYQVRVTGNFLAKTGQQTVKVDLPIDGKPALSHLTLRQFDAERQESLLDVLIDTGRKHQIRKHCASLALPVVGDARYARADPRGLQLKAYRLAFVCPIKKQLVTYTLDHTVDDIDDC